MPKHVGRSNLPRGKTPPPSTSPPTTTTTITTTTTSSARTIRREHGRGGERSGVRRWRLLRLCVLGWACDREAEDAEEDTRRKIRRRTEEDGMNASGVWVGGRENEREREEENAPRARGSRRVEGRCGREREAVRSAMVGRIVRGEGACGYNEGRRETRSQERWLNEERERVSARQLN